MKCPKCDYLGFETGDRCRNCGYDFSLIAAPGERAPDLDLSLSGPGADVDPDLSAFPLFPGVDPAGDDTPLVTVPAKPRAPLAVRRAPEPPKRSRTPRGLPQYNSRLELDFATEDPVEPSTADPLPRSMRSVAPTTTGAVVASLGRRIVAALTDHAILSGVDVIVVLGTLRIAALAPADWRALPALPLLAFLVMMKLAYFAAFTALGGQTLGKMAVRIRVVADGEVALDPARAFRRAVVSFVAVLPLGAGLLPAVFDPGRRALHDRLAHTRVVELPSG